MAKKQGTVARLVRTGGLMLQTATGETARRALNTPPNGGLDGFDRIEVEIEAGPVTQKKGGVIATATPCDSFKGGAIADTQKCICQACEDTGGTFVWLDDDGFFGSHYACAYQSGTKWVAKALGTVGVFRCAAVFLNPFKGMKQIDPVFDPDDPDHLQL